MLRRAGADENRVMPLADGNSVCWAMPSVHSGDGIRAAVSDVGFRFCAQAMLRLSDLLDLFLTVHQLVVQMIPVSSQLSVFLWRDKYKVFWISKIAAKAQWLFKMNL